MKIGKYEIKGRLGRGGMGVVYKAAMPLTGKIVALKVCRPAEIMLDLMGAGGVRKLFLAEAVAMAEIRHPHVATVLDVGEAEVPDYDGGIMTMPFFAMEYYCTDLGQVMGENYEVEHPSRIIPPEDALEYIRQMLEGLRRLHFSGLVHRDVKPFNVMLTDEDEVKLIDFGLSRKRGERTGKVVDTPRGMVVGSPYYTAPEQERDADSADQRADLFSVGVTLFRMLTGQLPVTESGERRTVLGLYAYQDNATGNALGWCPDAAWDKFLDRAMQLQPEARYQSAKEMLAALSELSEHWEKAKAEACQWVEPSDVGAASVPDSVAETLRSAPLKINQKEARRCLGLDELWRPIVKHAPDLSQQGEIVLDRATGLAWQASGSEYPLDYKQAQEYVENLRETRYQGYSDWRLPTVPELSSLVGSVDLETSMCLPPLFDSAQQRLWSSDRKAFTAVWYVNARKGFVWWQDETCRFFVRAVCDVD